MNQSGYSLADAFFRVTELIPGKVALEDENKQFRFYEVKERVLNWVRLLQQSGFQHGDRLAIYSNNSHYFVEVFFASSLLGLILVPINLRLKKEEIAYILSDCLPKGIVIEKQETFPFPINELNKYDIQEIFVINDGTVEKDFERLNQEYRLPVLSQDDAIVICYTASVDGKPRGAVITHQNYLVQITQTKLALALKEEDVYGSFLPLYHVLGLKLICMSFLSGMMTILISRFNPLNALKTIVNSGVSFFVEFAPMAVRIFEESEKQKVSLGKYLRFVAGLDIPETIEKYLSSGVSWYNFYGQSETNGIVTMGLVNDPYKERHYIGYPASSTRVSIRDDAGRVLGLGEIGEICIRSQVCFAGYYKQERASRYTEDGWLLTGDLAYMAEDGSLWFCGRKNEKELIKTGGENVYPAEVERELLQHPEIEKVCVFGVPDPVWREAVKAVVVLKDGSHLSEQDVIQYCKRRLASYKCPSRVEFVDSLPLIGDEANREEVKRIYGK